MTKKGTETDRSSTTPAHRISTHNEQETDALLDEEDECGSRWRKEET